MEQKKIVLNFTSYIAQNCCVVSTSITINDRQEIANAFNKHFLTVAKNINMKQTQPSYHKLDNTTPLHFLTRSFNHPVSKYEVEIGFYQRNWKNYKTFKTKKFFWLWWNINQINKNKFFIY